MGLVFKTMKDGGTPPGTFLAAFWDNGSALFPAMVVYDIAAGGLVGFSSASPVTLSPRQNEPVAAGQTDQVMGATGAIGDVLDYILVVPATTSPGAVQIKDGTGSEVTVFTGGAGSVSSLVPFPIPWGKAATGAGWKISTGANVSVIPFGSFT
jgi:hypothetical protein